jgi:hypothetical protein
MTIVMEFLTVDSWKSLDPIFSMPAVFVPAFKASLQPGHFVKVFNNGDFLIGRIIATSTRLDDIDVAERGENIEDQPENSLGGFVKINWFFQQSFLSFTHPDIVTASCNLYTSSNVEVFQTKLVSWLNTARVLELCFVFYYNDVVEGKFCCEGMKNAFYIRYRYSGEAIIEPISKEGQPFVSFPSLFPMYSSYWSSCWSSEVWDAITMVQQAVTGLLCRYSQSQGMHPSGRSRLTIPAGVMSYIQLWLRHRNIFASRKRCSRMQKHVRIGIIFRKIKNEVIGLCWRFDTESKLEVLAQLFGRNITIGVRRRPPKLGVSYSAMQNDKLNVVVGKPGEGDTDATTKTDCRGIDFIYHAPYLEIYVRSSEFIVGGKESPPTENLRVQLVNVPATSEAWQRSLVPSHIELKVKQRFQVHNSVFRIVSVAGNIVEALCVFGPIKGTSRTFNAAEVSSAVLDKIST